MKFSWSVTLMVAVGLAVVSCGGDDDDDDGAAGSTGAGAGGMSGSAGVGGQVGGTGGSTMMMTGVPCGVTMCMGMSIPGLPPGAGGMFGALLPQPCCLDASMNKCGQSSMGGACMPPPPPPVTDSRCPPLMVFGMSMPGCCIDNMCGVNASLLGMGCLENGKAAMGGGMLPIMYPPPQACDAPPPMMTDDGGTMMMPPTNQGDAGI
jgi:hypothetical protein